MKSFVKKLNVIQVIVCITLFITMFQIFPWLFSHHISKITRYPEVAIKNPPPEWAKSFSVGPSGIDYYSDDVREKPLKAIIFVTLLSGQFFFLITTAIYSFKTKTNTSWKNAVIKSFKEMNEKNNN